MICQTILNTNINYSNNINNTNNMLSIHSLSHRIGAQRCEPCQLDKLFVSSGQEFDTSGSRTEFQWAKNGESFWGAPDLLLMLGISIRYFCSSLYLWASTEVFVGGANFCRGEQMLVF